MVITASTDAKKIYVALKNNLVMRVFAYFIILIFFVVLFMVFQFDRHHRVQERESIESLLAEFSAEDLFHALELSDFENVAIGKDDYKFQDKFISTDSQSSVYLNGFLAMRVEFRSNDVLSVSLNRVEYR